MKKSMMAIIATIFMSRPTKTTQAGSLGKDRFWEWFRENKSFLEQYDKKTDEVMEQLQEKLEEIYPDLRFEIGQDKDGIYEFVISAGGLKSAIDSVLELYKSAPKIDGWRIIAFKPRQAVTRVEHGGIDFKLSDFMYSSSYNEGMTDIELYIRGFRMGKEETYAMAGFLFLDTVIGEYDVMTRLGNIKFHPLPEEGIAFAGDDDGVELETEPEQMKRLKPLAELAAEIDAVSGCDIPDHNIISSASGCNE